MKIDGKQMAQDILDSLRPQVENLKKKNIIPTLAVVLMGDNDNSTAYVRQKEIKAKEIGAEVKIYQFDQNIDSQVIASLVQKLNKDSAVHGIILQRPAPSQVKVDELEQLIDPVKEVDGFGVQTNYPVPVAEAVWRMILSVLPENQLANKKIVVLGKGETAGNPIIEFLKKRGLRPEIIDSHTQNRDKLLKNADVIISAVGKHNVLSANEIKKGAVVIGVGLSTDKEGKLKGDFENEEVEETL